MNNLKVVRKELVFNREDFDCIEDYIDGYNDHFNIQMFKFEFENYFFTLRIGMDILSKKLIILSYLYKKDTVTGEYTLLLDKEENITDIYCLFKIFKFSTKEMTKYENIEIYIQFHVEDIVKDRDFYKHRLNSYNKMNINQRHNILQYVDCNNKAELFQGLYFLVEQEDFYRNLFHKPIRTDEETLILKELKSLVERLEYFGYEEKDDEHKALFELEDKIQDFFRCGKGLSSDNILNYFIIGVFNLINKGMTISIPDKRKSALYYEYYKQLEIEGYL